jgi:hypothetical protein
MKAESGPGHLIAAILGAAASFCLVGVGIYYRMAHVGVNGWMHGGPAMLLAAMGGLFGGGLVAVLVLIVLLKWLNGR